MLTICLLEIAQGLSGQWGCVSARTDTNLSDGVEVVESEVLRLRLEKLVLGGVARYDVGDVKTILDAEYPNDANSHHDEECKDDNHLRQ